MTSNESIEQITYTLETEDKKNPNIRINYAIKESAEFLDTFIENDQGKLRTSVFRKQAAEPYILPYTSDHPRHIHINTIYTGLLRAGRLCSDVDNFNEERQNIEIALLLNSYPPKFIKKHFERFFKQNQIRTVFTKRDSIKYQQFHQRLLNPLDPVSAQLQNFTTEDSNNNYVTKADLKQIKIKNYVHTLILHYTYESGPIHTFKREFRKLWEKHFYYDSSQIKQIRLIMGTISHKTLEQLIVQKKPTKKLLTIPKSSTD